jgi:signal transduction histidine kinase
MRSRIWLIAIPFAIVSVVVTLNLFFYRSYEAETAAQINRQQLIIAKTVAGSIGDTIEHYGKEAADLAILLSLRGLDKVGLDEFLGHAFTELKEDLDATAALFTPDGRVLYAIGNGSALTVHDPGVASVVPRIMGLEPGKYLVDLGMVSRGLLYLGSPVVRAGDVRGILVVRVRLDDINRKFMEPVMGDGPGHAWIMDSAGTLIFHPKEPAMVGRNIYTHDEYCSQCHASFETEKRILRSTGGVGYSSYQAPYGEDKLVAFSWIKTLDWVVCISIPYSEVTASIGQSMRLHSLLVITISIMTVIGASVIIYINRERVRAETRARYADRIREYAGELESVVRDRTRELRGEKEKLDAVVNSVRAGLSILDEQGRAQWMNPVMGEWLSGERAARFSLRDVYDDADAVEAVCLTVGRGYPVGDVLELDLGRKAGFFQFSISLLHVPEEGRRFLMLLQDVSDLKRAEERLMRTEKLIALARVSAGVAHEIGNPLTSISSYVQILKGMEHDAFTADAIDTIMRQIHRIDAIIKKMSDFSKDRVGEREHGDLCEIVRSSLDLLRYDRRSRHMKVDVLFPEGLPKAYVDANQLVQVFVNIAMNAADAMPEGGTLTVSGRAVEGALEVSFRDSGPGMPRAVMDRIFDPFFTTKERGTGLGLAVSYGIMRSMGGAIGVEGAPEGGTVFTVRVPVEDAVEEGESVPNTGS